MVSRAPRRSCNPACLRQPGTASSAGPKPITEGLSINEIAARYFISPRTAQTHLTHFYNKLGLSSRLAVVKEATKHLYPRHPDRGQGGRSCASAAASGAGRYRWSRTPHPLRSRQPYRTVTDAAAAMKINQGVLQYHQINRLAIDLGGALLTRAQRDHPMTTTPGQTRPSCLATVVSGEVTTLSLAADYKTSAGRAPPPQIAVPAAFSRVATHQSRSLTDFGSPEPDQF